MRPKSLVARERINAYLAAKKKQKGLPMQIQLSGKPVEIIKAQIAAGFYGDAAAFVSDLVLKYEAYYNKKLATLNQEIAIGLEQANRGECVAFDFEEFMQEVDEELGYLDSKS